MVLGIRPLSGLPFFQICLQNPIDFFDFTIHKENNVCSTTCKSLEAPQELCKMLTAIALLDPVSLASPAMWPNG